MINIFVNYQVGDLDNQILVFDDDTGVQLAKIATDIGNLEEVAEDMKKGYEQSGKEVNIIWSTDLH